MSEKTLTRQELADIEQWLSARLKCKEGLTIKCGDQVIKMGEMGPETYQLDTQAQEPGAGDCYTPEQDVEVDVPDHIAALYAPKHKWQPDLNCTDFTVRSLESLKVPLNFLRTGLDEVIKQECSSGRLKRVHSDSHLDMMYSQAGRLSVTPYTAWVQKTESHEMTASLNDVTDTFLDWDTASQEMRFVIDSSSMESFTSYETDSDEYTDDDEDDDDGEENEADYSSDSVRFYFEMDEDTVEAEDFENDDGDDDNDDAVEEKKISNVEEILESSDECSQQVNNQEVEFCDGSDNGCNDSTITTSDDRIDDAKMKSDDECNDTNISKPDDKFIETKIKSDDEINTTKITKSDDEFIETDIIKSDDAQKDVLKPDGSGDRRPGLFKRMKTSIVKLGRRIKNAFSFKSTRANKKYAKLMPFYSEATIEV